LKKQIFLFALIPILALLTSLQAAKASDSSTEVKEAIPSDLYISGIDEQRAIAAGNQVVVRNGSKVLIDGKTGFEITRIQIKPSSEKIDIVPKNAVAGNCGTSYLYMQNLGGRKYQFSTGFDLSAGKALNFSWQILINSQWTFPRSGSYNFQWSDSGPVLLTAHWTSGWKLDQSTAPSGSLHVGRLMQGVVYRSDGAICTSGYPTASLNVY
jgi:hypothetical protein